jgi:beta-phosphoglucomutase
MTAFQGAIFDVDGVLVDSPHELAWREAFRALMEGEWRDVRDQTSWTAERFTPAVYQQVMAGMPRMAGARAAMEHFGVPDIDDRIEQYAAGKQEHVIKLIEDGRFMAFPDALRFILAVKDMGVQVAAASSSKNAKLFLERIRLDTFAAEQRLEYDFIRPGMTLQELFDADISGRDFPRGKPDPTIFLTAAEELSVPPSQCFVVEDASTGIQAAKAARMAALGVARLDDRDLLVEAGADMVETTLDDVSLRALAEGRLEERRAAAERRRRFDERPPSVWSLVYDSFDAGRQGLREARTWPAYTTGPTPRSPAVRSPTRTSSMSPTGYLWSSGSPAASGSTSSMPRFSPIAWSSTCSRGPSRVTWSGRSRTGGARALSSAGS